VATIYDSGTGAPIVMIPGVQGRWEWMRPALDALSAHCRVISYSLARPTSIDDLLRQVDGVLADRGVDSAAVCGVSFGGTLAARYAATRPSRAAALVVASAPGPSWTPSTSQAKYLSSPWLSTPAFLLTSPPRMWPEIAAAIPDIGARLRFCLAHAARIVSAPIVPASMAARMRLRPGDGLGALCASITAPALVVTGEPDLDRVVPVASTREFLTLIRGAKYEMMEGTGHIGLVTQPERFARIVGTFVNASRS